MKTKISIEPLCSHDIHVVRFHDHYIDKNNDSHSDYVGVCLVIVDGEGATINALIMNGDFRFPDYLVDLFFVLDELGCRTLNYERWRNGAVKTYTFDIQESIIKYKNRKF